VEATYISARPENCTHCTTREIHVATAKGLGGRWRSGAHHDRIPPSAASLDNPGGFQTVRYDLSMDLGGQTARSAGCARSTASPLTQAGYLLLAALHDMHFLGAWTAMWKWPQCNRWHPRSKEKVAPMGSAQRRLRPLQRRHVCGLRGFHHERCRRNLSVSLCWRRPPRKQPSAAAELAASQLFLRVSSPRASCLLSRQQRQPG